MSLYFFVLFECCFRHNFGRSVFVFKKCICIISALSFVMVHILHCGSYVAYLITIRLCFVAPRRTFVSLQTVIFKLFISTVCFEVIYTRVSKFGFGLADTDSLVIAPFVKGIYCFLQMFYISFMCLLVVLQKDRLQIMLRCISSCF